MVNYVFEFNKNTNFKSKKEVFSKHNKIYMWKNSAGGNIIFVFHFIKILIKYFLSIDFFDCNHAKKDAKKRAKSLDRKRYYIIK